MKITKSHTSVNFNSGNSGRKYIVVHYTGNRTDTAKANANYFRSAYRGASAHYFVDETSIYEVVSPSDTAWAVGVDYGGKLFGRCTNGNSISIEMCSTNGKIAAKTYENTVWLTKQLMARYGIGAGNVVRHYDVCNKQCPGWKGWTGSDQSLWKKFKNDIAGKAATTTAAKPAQTATAAKSYKVKVTADVLNVRAGAGTSYKVNTTVKKGQVYTIVGEKKNGSTTWGKLKSGAGWISLAYTKKC